MEFISSSENSVIKKLKKLKQKKYRDEEGLFLAEGRKFLDFEENPEYILLKDEVVQNYSAKIEKFSCKKIAVPEKIFNQLTSQENSQGILLVYRKKDFFLSEVEGDVVVLDKVQNPGNLGTIFRVIDACGLKNIILIKGSVDCYNEKVIRSTMGSIFNLNIIHLTEEECAKFLLEKKYNILVTALDKNSIPYTDMKLSEKNAIIFGSEGDGVSQKFLDISTEKLIIPIYGSAESLNVAIASGIILYKFIEMK